MWGAFSSLLFATFAVCFMRYNKNKFYSKKPGWDKFDITLKKIYGRDEKLNTMADG